MADDLDLNALERKTGFAPWANVESRKEIHALISYARSLESQLAESQRRVAELEQRLQEAQDELHGEDL